MVLGLEDLLLIPLSVQAFLFSSPCKIDIRLNDAETRTRVDIPRDKGTESLFLFVGDDPVSGIVTVEPQNGKKIEHKGIKIELIGQIGISKSPKGASSPDRILYNPLLCLYLSHKSIELFYARDHYVFTSLINELAPAGLLAEKTTYNFDFSTCEKQYESYNGINVRLR